MDRPEAIEYPNSKSTQVWGKVIIDKINEQNLAVFDQIKQMKDDINGNIDSKFNQLIQDLNVVRTTAGDALQLAKKMRLIFK